jgi:hypothetical protein
MNYMFIFYVHFFVTLDYDEMNCNIIFRVLYNVFWSVDVICNNHEFGVGMNGSVKFVET